MACLNNPYKWIWEKVLNFFRLVSAWLAWLVTIFSSIFFSFSFSVLFKWVWFFLAQFCFTILCVHSLSVIFPMFPIVIMISLYGFERPFFFFLLESIPQEHRWPLYSPKEVNMCSRLCQSNFNNIETMKCKSIEIINLVIKLLHRYALRWI